MKYADDSKKYLTFENFVPVSILTERCFTQIWDNISFVFEVIVGHFKEYRSGVYSGLFVHFRPFYCLFPPRQIRWGFKTAIWTFTPFSVVYFLSTFPIEGANDYNIKINDLI